MRSARVLGVLALVLAAPLAASGCGSHAAGAERVPGRILRVYASVPLRGPGAAAGRDVADAERLALAGAGGRAGRYRVRLTVLDSTDPRQRRWTPAVVAAGARRAAHDPRTIAYLGETDPAASAVSVVILDQAGIASLSPTDSFAGVTRPEGDAAAEPAKYYPREDRTFARLVPDDVLQARAIIAWMRRDGVRHPALLHDDDIYGRSLAEEIDREAGRAGLHPVIRDAVELGSSSFQPEVAKLRPLHADAVFLGAAPLPGVGRLLGAVRRGLGSLPVFAPGALDSQIFVDGLAPQVQSVLRLTDPVAAAPGDQPGRDRLAAAFARRYGRRPGAAAAFGYEAMRAVLATLREQGARANRRPRVMRALLRHRAGRGALGGYVLEPGGRTSRRAIGLFRVVGGTLRRTGTLSPSG